MLTPTDTQKAYNLLMNHLDPGQQFTFQNLGFFYVRGSDMRLYALWDGYWIAEIDKEKPKEQLLGAHARRNLPKSDLLLAQKLMLETNARRVRRICCHTFLLDGRAMPYALQFGTFFKAPREVQITMKVPREVQQMLQSPSKLKRFWRRHVS